jgi:hypothetical protein
MEKQCISRGDVPRRKTDDALFGSGEGVRTMIRAQCPLLSHNRAVGFPGGTAMILNRNDTFKPFEDASGAPYFI